MSSDDDDDDTNKNNNNNNTCIVLRGLQDLTQEMPEKNWNRNQASVGSVASENMFWQ